ncbi:MAG: DUF1844 domain-containing protein [Bacillota bacterium]
MRDNDDRGTADAGTPRTPPPDPEAASRLAEEARQAVGYIASLSAGDMIQWAIAGLAEKAWERMGLVANPATGKITRDFEDARLAIDAIAALVDLLAPRIEPAGLRRLQTLLADLRINYAAQRSRAESAPRQDAQGPHTEPPYPAGR